MTQDREPLMPDQAVSEAYRKLATERAPAALDARILAAARAEARTRYGLLRTRTRPLAWAAMIGLSLVIVLQIVRVPDGSEVVPVESTMPATAEKVRGRNNYEVMSEESSAPAVQAMPDEARRGASKAVIAEDSPVGAAPAEMSPAPAAAVRGKPGRAETDATDLAEGDAVAADQRQDQVRTAPASAFAPGLPTMSAAADPDREETIAALTGAACGESARETPESWLECIEALREKGDTVVADAEFELLRAAFPDFPVEERHK